MACRVPVTEARRGYNSHEQGGVGGAAELGGGDDAMTVTTALFSLYRLHVPRGEEGGRCDRTCILCANSARLVNRNGNRQWNLCRP